MKTLNQELLGVVQDQAKHLDTIVNNRIKRFRIDLSGNAPHTVVSLQGSDIAVTVYARDSIRFRDGGFRRGYHKGVRSLPPSGISYAKARPPKRANIINRPMFAMVHRLQELGVLRLADVTISNLIETLK